MSRLRSAVRLAAALSVAALTFTLVTLPPRARQLPPLAATIVPGAYHVHTTLSDGSGTVEDVALAAAQAGLRFLLLTDHGDATRPPMPPAYVHGVLVIDNVEISTNQGHMVALGLTQPAPYPLGGEAADVLEDVHRLGGWAVIAHPDSPKPDLQWRARGLVADGIEWLNEDSEWRAATASEFAYAILHAPIRPSESFASIMAPPTASLRRWDTAARSATVIGLAAADAHGAPASAMGGISRALHLSLAAYRMAFGAVDQSVILDAPLSGQAAPDAARILAAIRGGRTFSVVTGFARPATIDLRADDGQSQANMGERLVPHGSTVRLTATVPDAPTARLVLLNSRREVASGIGTVQATVDAEPAEYRVEAFLDERPLPWIVSNSVYVGAPPVVVPPPPAAIAPHTAAVSLDAPGEWRIERGAPASGETTFAAGDREVQFAFGRTGARDQFVALVHDLTHDRASCEQLVFVGRAARPMRVWVQMRLLGPAAERWGVSVYLDATPRTIVIPLRSLLPIGFAATRRPVSAEVHALLFVVDRTNTADGASGTFWVSNVRLGSGGGPSGPDGQ